MHTVKLENENFKSGISTEGKCYDTIERIMDSIIGWLRLVIPK